VDVHWFSVVVVAQVMDPKRENEVFIFILGMAVGIFLAILGFWVGG